MNIFCSAICKSMVVIYQVIVNLIFCLLCRLFSYFTTKTFKGLDCKIVNFSLSVCVTRSLVLCLCFMLVVVIRQSGWRTRSRLNDFWLYVVKLYYGYIVEVRPRSLPKAASNISCYDRVEVERRTRKLYRW
jgi:uncharacterized protein YacL